MNKSILETSIQDFVDDLITGPEKENILDIGVHINGAGETVVCHYSAPYWKNIGKTHMNYNKRRRLQRKKAMKIKMQNACGCNIL